MSLFDLEILELSVTCLELWQQSPAETKVTHPTV